MYLPRTTRHRQQFTQCTRKGAPGSWLRRAHRAALATALQDFVGCALSALACKLMNSFEAAAHGGVRFTLFVVIQPLRAGSAGSVRSLPVHAAGRGGSAGSAHSTPELGSKGGDGDEFLAAVKVCTSLSGLNSGEVLTRRPRCKRTARALVFHAVPVLHGAGAVG